MTATLLAILAGLCWGVGEICTKSALHSGKIGPITAIALRSTIALPVMWCVYVVVVHGRHLEPANWLRATNDPVLWKVVLGSGLIAGAGGMIFFYLSLSLGDISRVKPIAFVVAPATAVLLGWMLLGEPMTMRKAIALALVLAGVLLLASSGDASRAN